jgi:addiction module HigA family antidote
MFQARKPVAIHPGEILREEFMKPLGLTQEKLAQALRVPVQRVNLLLNGKRGITPDSAYRLARYFGTSPELWAGLQLDWDLRSARDRGIARQVADIVPRRRSA